MFSKKQILRYSEYEEPIEDGREGVNQTGITTIKNY